MSLKIWDFFNPRATPPDANYTNGSIKDRSLPGVLDGTPLVAADRNDLIGFTDALLIAGSVTASGVPDTAQASDRLEALLNVISLYEPISGGGVLEVNRKYLILDAGTYTLPDTTDLVIKDRVDLMRLVSVLPVIQVDGSNSEVIKYYKPTNGLLSQTDTSASYNVFSPISFVFNTDWEL